jgi:hypothetical protein
LGSFITTLVLLLGLWEWFGRDINPVFGSYPTAIVESFWTMTLTPLPRRWLPLFVIQLHESANLKSFVT